MTCVYCLFWSKSSNIVCSLVLNSTFVKQRSQKVNLVNLALKWNKTVQNTEQFIIRTQRSTGLYLTTPTPSMIHTVCRTYLYLLVLLMCVFCRWQPTSNCVSRINYSTGRLSLWNWLVIDDSMTKVNIGSTPWTTQLYMTATFPGVSDFKDFFLMLDLMIMAKSFPHKFHQNSSS